MSDRRLILSFTPEAREDVEQVFLYGLEMWDADQAERYERALNEGFQHIQRHPEIGERVEHTKLAVRGFRIRHHTVYYRIGNDTIEIIRVLHERQQVTSLTFRAEDQGSGPGG